MASALAMPAFSAAAKFDDAEGVSTAHGSAAETASFPSSPSSPSSAAAGGDASTRSFGTASEAPTADDLAQARFARRPSVGTWLLPRPHEIAAEIEARVSPFDRFMMLIHPGWVATGQHHDDQELIEADEEDEAVEEARPPKAEEEALLEVDFEAAVAFAAKHKALEEQAFEVARDLSAIAASWSEVVEERCGSELEYSQAVADQQRLQERVARLRSILQRAKGARAGEAELVVPRAPLGQLGSAGVSQKLCKRAQLLRSIPSMISRAECFDQDEDGLGDSPLEELEREAAALAAFRDEASAEFEKMEQEAREMHRLRSAAREENRQLELRIEHLRTCVASAKQKAASGGKDSAFVEPKAGRASFGGC